MKLKLMTTMMNSVQTIHSRSDVKTVNFLHLTVQSLISIEHCILT